MSRPRVASIDHLVLTVGSIEETCDFYVRVLGMEAESFRAADGTARIALRFGRQKINLHQRGREYDPKAARPTPGSGDLCLLTEAPLADWVARLDDEGVPIEEGPVPRNGATGPIRSLYIRDPDGNLVEIARRN
jgi:catechol 2,3-dioxygenase-like lactoylglutathione lyase family enzyme